MRTRLGPLEAVRQITRYECEGLAGVYVTDEFVALSRCVVYKVALDTAEARYRDDRAVLEAVARSFSLLPLPTVSSRR